ncbi:MAG TPA: hypothetical protein VFE16_01475 [Candidatus Cybelea sp.]|jgi:hypothetical protein|nr:hypothetical protein [Candidatus Cybelea sp.]
MRPDIVGDSSALTERSGHLHWWQRCVAVLAGTVALALNVAAAAELFAPQTTFGYRVIYTKGFEVAIVDPETPAARAGIAAGDVLDFRTSTLHDRIVGLEYQPARPGERVGFVVSHDGRAHRLQLTAGAVTPSQVQHAIFSPLASFLRLTGFAYIVVALIILLRRPSRMTWGLFLYLVASTNVELYRFPEGLAPAAAFASDLLGVAGLVGLVIFAVRFPNDNATGWRAGLDRLAIPIGALFAIPNLAWDALALFRGESPAAWMSYGSTLGALALILIAGGTLVTTYFAAQHAQRQRLQWVIAGIFFTLLSSASGWARYWSPAYPFATSDAVAWTATVLYACAPFALAYAVVRQRVFDISFVISRTLVYTFVTATVFGGFALIEWFVGHVLEQSGIAIVVVALAAIGIAFSFDALYSRAENFVERTLFRRRHLAERHMASVTAGLPYAENDAAVEAALVAEPIHAYALISAELFRRDQSGNFFCDGNVLDRRIALQLQGHRRALRLHADDPALAIPIFMRAHLEAVALYSVHANGEDIDPDEAASLEAMGVAAGIAYDHLETARVEREGRRWRRIAERQARELAVLRERASHDNGTG